MAPDEIPERCPECNTGLVREVDWLICTGCREYVIDLQGESDGIIEV